MKGRDVSGRIRRWAARLKANLAALWYAAKDPRTPTAAKVLAGITLAYALSPIDLIPDFIPLLGYLDDVILLPLGVLLCIRLIPPELWREFLQQGESLRLSELPRSRTAGVLIVLIWTAAIVGILLHFLR